jgi:hypothetical protein
MQQHTHTQQYTGALVKTGQGGSHTAKGAGRGLIGAQGCMPRNGDVCGLGAACAAAAQGRPDASGMPLPAPSTHTDAAA